VTGMTTTKKPNNVNAERGKGVEIEPKNYNKSGGYYGGID